MRTLILVLLLGVPVSAQTYPELTGMFTHAAGWTESDFGVEQYAWGHEGLPEGCAQRYVMPLRYDLATHSMTGEWSGYERFCVVNGWVRLMGYGNLGSDPWFAPIVVNGEDGQKYAPVTLERTAFCESGEIRGRITLAFTDCQTWAPTDTGWSQHETFQYLSGEHTDKRFTSISLFDPRVMYRSAWRHWEIDGAFYSEQIRSVLTFTW